MILLQILVQVVERIWSRLANTNGVARALSNWKLIYLAMKELIQASDRNTRDLEVILTMG